VCRTFEMTHVFSSPQRTKQMDVAAYSETPVIVRQTARRYKPEDVKFEFGLPRAGCSEVFSDGLTIEYADARS
jgi:hypothetical protein